MGDTAENEIPEAYHLQLGYKATDSHALNFVRLPTPSPERKEYLNPNDLDDSSHSTSLKMSLWKPAEAPPTKLGRYRALSSTAGVHVSPLCLGAMVSTFGYTRCIKYINSSSVGW